MTPDGLFEGATVCRWHNACNPLAWMTDSFLAVEYGSELACSDAILLVLSCLIPT